MIEMSENYIRNKGFKEVRVRCQGTSARIEVPSEQIQNFVLSYKKDELVNYFMKLGFKSISLDLEGLVSGKLNR